MKRHHGLFVLAALGLAILMAGCWGSSKDTSLEIGTAPQPARVGFQQCINTCHATTPDHITGLVIKDTWMNSIHYEDGKVECEDCHGGGGDHWGVGPIPEPNPTNTCAACHDFPGFTATRHYDQKNEPGPLFFQADAGTGQAEYFGEPEFLPDGVTPVSRAQHIEECSRCHNPSQEFLYARDGSLDKPNPEAMPVPHVSCGGCHDGHDPMTDTDLVTQRGGADVPYPRFRNYLVDPATGAQTDNAAIGIGLTTLNLIFQPNGAVLGLSTPNFTRVVGGNNELLSERLCASCHTKGKYKYSQVVTHQLDTYTQWTQSGHGDRAAAAFGEFSAKPSFYDPAFPEGAGTHQSIWPYDMAIGSTTGGSGKVGAIATTSQNAAVGPDSRGSFNDNYQCYKCHNGLTSLAYQDDVQGTSAAPVVFGDEPVTCVTCHDPHTNVGGQKKNTRKPVVMTKYSGSTPSNKPNRIFFSFSGNVFLDNTAVPPETGNETICVFCHQGRESGLTLFKSRLFDNVYLDNNNFLNPHYLGTGAMLWARNAYEYAGKQYGAVAAHQQTNCNGCHMSPGRNPNGTDNAEIGGHTWKIVSDDDSVVNSATCNQASCHNNRVPTTNSGGEFDNFSDNIVATVGDYDGNGAFEGIPVEIAGLESDVIALLNANGIDYSDIDYPYFFNLLDPPDHTSANGFKNWRLATLKAAFNLSFVIKGLPAEATTQVGEPNTSAAVHNYRYNIQVLHDSYEDLYNDLLARALPIPAGLPAPGAMSRPAGTRPATNYANPGSAVYSPQQ